jgi:hypothetical protein
VAVPQVLRVATTMADDVEAVVVMVVVVRRKQ